jgi:PPOX class probable F420-dependent enzyme
VTEEELASFWREPHLAKLATINRDGTPHLVPIWYLHDGRNLVIVTRSQSRKVQNIRRDPRVTVCIDRPTPPYAGVIVRGTASLQEVPYQDMAVPMAVRYLGQDAGALIGAEYAKTDLMTIRVAIDHISSWDFSQGT